MNRQLCQPTDKVIRSKADARRTASRMWREGVEPVLPYLCRHCGGWHVGRPNPVKDHARTEEGQRAAEWAAAQNSTERSGTERSDPLPSAPMATTFQPTSTSTSERSLHVYHCGGERREYWLLPGEQVPDQCVVCKRDIPREQAVPIAPGSMHKVCPDCAPRHRRFE